MLLKNITFRKRCACARCLRRAASICVRTTATDRSPAPVLFCISCRGRKSHKNTRMSSKRVQLLRYLCDKIQNTGIVAGGRKTMVVPTPTKGKIIVQFLWQWLQLHRSRMPQTTLPVVLVAATVYPRFAETYNTVHGKHLYNTSSGRHGATG